MRCSSCSGVRADPHFSARVWKGRASQPAEEPVEALILSEALECGSLLPLWLEPACWRGIVPSAEIPASKLAERKAAASCRTPKLRMPAQAARGTGATEGETGLRDP
jgi:hypothetical protein